MLILTRKINEAIITSNGVTFRILSVERDRVKIGIEAAPEISIMREEIVDLSMPEGIKTRPVK